MKKCAECGIEFKFKTHNQKYCTPECCRKSTNKKIMKKYYEKKEILNGKKRLCGCGAIISRYNLEAQCHTCQEKVSESEKDKRKKELENVAKRTKKTNRRPRPWD